MKPHEFVGFWRQRKLHFVVRPDYLAGLEDSEQQRRRNLFQVHPLVLRRATIDPGNWDTSRLPSVQGDDYPEFMLDEALRTLAGFWWSRLGGLDEEDFGREIDRPLSSYAVPSRLMAQIAYGVESAARARYAGTLFGNLSLPPAEFSAMVGAMTPDGFVGFIREYGVELGFVSEPSNLGGAAMQWVSRGYAPW